MTNEVGTQKLVPAEEVVLQSRKIATLVQLATFLKATEVGIAGQVGAQIQMQILDRQHTGLFINSNLIKDVLIAEFDKLGEELTAAGIDLEDLLKAEGERFKQLYLPKEG